MKTKSFVAAAVLCLMVSIAACKTAKKSDETTGGNEGGPSSQTIDTGTTGGTADSDSGNAMGLQTVHFPYDAFSLSGEAKGTLKNNAQILKDKPSLKVQVEGHCDSRGGIQYNIALGEKRANAVKKYLEGMGVKGDRVSTISYGKERLIAQGETEEAHAKNRRANFVVTSR